MNETTNIPAILRGKPQGTKLHDLVRGTDVFLNNVVDGCDKVCCTFVKNGLQKLHYSSKGTLVGFEDGMVILVPSETMQDWNKFAWKKGDVLVSNDGGTEVIFDKWYDETYTSFYCKHYLNSEDENKIVYHEAFLCTTERYSLEDKDSVQTYINTLEKRLGGKLNRETLEIEKAEFKYGDIAFADYGNRQIVFVVSSKTDIKEGYNSFISLCLNGITTLDVGYRRSFFKKDLFELRLATEAEKQQLFSALKKQSKVWDAEKKMIVDLKPKVEFKTLDYVLCKSMACYEGDAWNLFQYAYQNKDGIHIMVEGSAFKRCIPYKGNEHLLGTTKEVDDLK